MKRSIKILSGILATVLFITLIDSCRKTDKINTNQEAITIEKIKNQLSDQPYKITHLVNKPGIGYYSDENGNRISVTTGSAGQRIKDYPECPALDDNYFSNDLYSIAEEFTCTQGYRVEVVYDVSVLFDLEYTNIAGTLNSYGRLRLKNSSNVVIWPSNPAPKYNVINIQDLGTDPSDPTLKRWRVTFITDYIPEGTFNSAASVEPSLTVYTDCANVPSIVIGYTSEQATTSTQNLTLPCRRVDKVSYNPASGGTPNNLSGCNATPPSCLPYGYIMPQQQEIEYYNGSTWGHHFSLYWYGPIYNTNGIIGNTDLWFIDTGVTPAGTYQVRYRNKQNTGYGGPCVSDIWVYTTWVLL